MNKLIKYELKGTYKFMLSILIVLIIASMMFQFSIRKIALQEELSYSYGNESVGILSASLIGLSYLVIFGAVIVGFFYIVNSFNNELSEDIGYLTFTLPVTGNQIIGSKTIVATIWYVGIFLVTLLFNFILASILLRGFGVNVFELVQDFVRNFWNLTFGQTIRIFIFFAISLGFGIISNLITIYFSMTLRKKLFGGNRYNWTWFLIYLLINGILGVLAGLISVKIPYFFSIVDLSIVDLGVEFGYLNSFGMNGLFSSITSLIGINIANTVFRILTTVGLFLGTGYFIDGRIDL